jgi:hypothetical protein
MRKNTETGSGRERDVAEYLSGTFLEQAKQAVEEQLVQQGRKRVTVRTGKVLKRQDIPHIERALLGLKQEYPELDRVRLSSGDSNNRFVVMSVKKQFEEASERTAQATAYFRGPAFLELMKQAVERDISDRGRKYADFVPAIAPRPQDMPYIQEAFLKLKPMYPELDNVRLNRIPAVLLTVSDPPCLTLVVDTKPNTLPRRMRYNIAHFDANGIR